MENSGFEKIIVAIGGGEIKNKTTLKIDEYIADKAKARAGEKRANALFFGTASHDSMPYFNSFRKTYTSVFDIKAEVALLVYGEMDMQRIADKINAADCIYVGGGDTVYMIELWRKYGVDELIRQAYERGVIIAGLSAGGICWFDKMYTDYEIMRKVSGEYVITDGLNWLEGLITPHYNERQQDFDDNFLKSGIKHAYAVENDCAVVFSDGKYKESVSSGGRAYLITNDDGALSKKEL